MCSEHHISGTEGICPICHQRMERIKPTICYCQHCKQNYNEQYVCPLCSSALQQIKGCGAINYICRKDGLISTNKVKFHYLPISGE